MKKLALIITLMTTLFGGASGARAAAADKDVHKLTTLWKTYYKASDDDRPQDMLSALESIRKEALQKKYAWDYYDACSLYSEVKTRQNWKERDAQDKLFRRRIEDLGVPVAIFYLDRYRKTNEELKNFIKENRAGLESGHNPEFYMKDYTVGGRDCGEVLSGQIRNDYDYALWFLYLERGLFRDELASGYPFQVQLLAKVEALQKREIRLNEKSPEEECLKLREDCRKFISEAEKLPSGQKEFALSLETPSRIIEYLESKDVRAQIKDGNLTIIVKNLDRVNATLKDKGRKTVWHSTLENKAGRFFLPDTLSAEIPGLPDGSYTLECGSGKTQTELDYEKHTISIASKEDADGIAVFAADHISGEPLESCTFQLLDETGKILADSGKMNTKEGFVRLPADFRKMLFTGNLNKPARIVATCSDEAGNARISKQLLLYKGYEPKLRTENVQHAAIITDRGAYNQGDTIHFKAILYTGTYAYNLCKQGIKASATLIGPKGNEIEKKDLATNEFGSVAADFRTDKNLQGGRYTIRMDVNGETVEFHTVRVDEFQVPTFTLEWEKRTEDIWLPAEEVHVRGTVQSYSGHSLSSARITYRIEGGQGTEEGELHPDSAGRLDIAVHPDPEAKYQYFNISVKVSDATGETQEFNTWLNLREKPETLEPTEYFFKEIEGTDPAVRVVAGSRTTWVVAELFGEGNRLLEKRLVRLEPEGGKPAEGVISWPFKSSYPDNLTLKVFYFQNSRYYSEDVTVRRPKKEYLIPLEFTRFLDTTSPAASYEFILKTAPGVECAASIFDISTETIQGNGWTRLIPAERPLTYVSYDFQSGSDGSSAIYRGIALTGRAMMAKNSAVMLESAGMATDSITADYGAPAPEVFEEEAAEAGGGAIAIRSNFANTIAWEPFLRSGKDGSVVLKFRTADKLSTYAVQIFAHDKDFNNNVLRREMLVTLPVKVAVIEPEYLYEADTYSARISLSNNLDKPVKGKVSVKFLRGDDYRTAPVLSDRASEITIPASGTAEFKFGTDCPQGIGKLGMLVSFQAADKEYGSDAVFVCMDVKKPVQTITEAHSAILKAGMDRDALEKELRDAFTGIPGSEASLREISILDMLLEAIPDSLEPLGEDVLSLTETLYAEAMLRKLGVGRLSDERKAEIEKKVAECLNPDGGYAWFKGMASSPIITAAVLQRSSLSGMQVDERTVKFLDSRFFADKRTPFWLGRISLEQYAYVRSLYADVPFSRNGLDSKEFKEFKKDIREYLLPKGKRGLNGMILAKARRVKTLQNLQGGQALASAWGIRINSAVEKSILADLESISQYAQPHASGATYFPNAVMPWRGLLESELHAHVLLCGLMEPRYPQISDGIRLWTMTQKETQEWKNDPAYIEALGEVLKGSDALLHTKVMALSATYTLPFSSIKATGNGFTVERKFFRGKEEVKEGDTLKVGERIRAEYRIWNGENRSHVLLTAPRPACLRPVDQLSFCNGNRYVDIRSDVTYFWYESYPEEDTVVTEDFYVTQEGRFQYPVLTVESLYAPHYRANDSFKSALLTLEN